jgi:DNA invertase Pin-like site-specific DNA recombinase
MVPNKLKELEAARAKLASLEKSIQAELNKELAALPAKFGFASAVEFAAAVTKAAGGRPGRKAPKAKAKARAAAAASGGAKKKRRKRAKITDATRAEVKKLVEAGKSGGEIAKVVGISLPSVQNIKKALGLVKKR